MSQDKQAPLSSEQKIKNALSVGDFTQAVLLVDALVNGQVENEDLLLLAMATYLHMANSLSSDIEKAQYYQGRALDICKKLANINPEHPIVHMQLGVLEFQAGDPYEAARLLKEATEKFPQASNLSKWYGHALLSIDDQENAIPAYKKAIEDPTQKDDVMMSLAFAYRNTGQVQASTNIMQDYLETHKDDLLAKFAYGQNLMALGRLEEGYPFFHARLQVNKELRSKIPCQIWEKGQSLENKVVLLLDEQGFGDSIQFARFIPELVKHAKAVKFAITSKMRAILAPVLTDVILVDDYQKESADIAIDIMSLPYAFDLSRQNIIDSYSQPYLSISDEKRAFWRQKLNEMVPTTRTDIKKVGVIWQGNLQSAAEQGRSLHDSEIARLFDFENTLFILMQHKDTKDNERPAVFNGNVLDFGQILDQGGDAFLDTAALMMELDMVVTSDTATAHLAGALGVPACVMLKYVPDWRWEIEGEESYWYPSLTLLRQERRGDWPGVIAKVKKKLS